MRVVIPSVGYADFLTWTLPAWRALLPSADIVVVTAPSDTATRTIAARYGRVLASEAWQRGGAVFNKGEALDEAIHSGPIREGDVCLSVDADVYPFGRLPTAIDFDTVYGCPRYHCADLAALVEHLEARRALSTFPLIKPRRARVDAVQLEANPSAADVAELAGAGLGYFQLFRYHPAARFEPSTSAGGCDVRFARRFGRRAPWLECYVLHLGAQDRANWRGRVVPAWGALT